MGNASRCAAGISEDAFSRVTARATSRYDMPAGSLTWAFLSSAAHAQAGRSGVVHSSTGRPEMLAGRGTKRQYGRGALPSQSLGTSPRHPVASPLITSIVELSKPRFVTITGVPAGGSHDISKLMMW